MNLKIFFFFFFFFVWNFGPDPLFLSNSLHVIWLMKRRLASAENMANTSRNYLRYKIEVIFLDFFLPIIPYFCEKYILVSA